MRNRFFFAAVAAVALAPALALANECKYTAAHDFDVDAAGLATAAFELGSDDLTVEGVPGLAKVEVRGKACASDPSWLGQLDVTQQRSGSQLSIGLHNDHHSGNWFGSNYAYLEVHVRVPASLAVVSRGSSGDADIRGVASLDAKTSSGDLRVARVAGALRLELSSGDVQGQDIGSVEVNRVSSGDIQLSEVHGDVHLDHCGSGDVSFDTVGGSVTIGDIGSGDVSLRHVDHDASVHSIGSGDVNASDIGGNFTVDRKGSGDVRHSNVRGKVSVPRDDD